jgi:hypothetical protein
MGFGCSNPLKESFNENMPTQIFPLIYKDAQA